MFVSCDIYEHCNDNSVVSPADASAEEKDGVFETVKLGLLFGAWYLANIYFNMYVVFSCRFCIAIPNIRV